ncbi:hypothetical protein COU61_03275 [Candidatus Pacearchaeota archaeon CG10_big_fil_rev_8_21_14_0_10_35_13]|nr:MAG: hypothetical protein COU61_03275 [Candidatus Pacearchaeota archaeon CG10_big_fil_rev_8_21_14_0_10_35_13]
MSDPLYVRSYDVGEDPSIALRLVIFLTVNASSFGRVDHPSGKTAVYNYLGVSIRVPYDNRGNPSGIIMSASDEGLVSFVVEDLMESTGFPFATNDSSD